MHSGQRFISCIYSSRQIQSLEDRLEPGRPDQHERSSYNRRWILSDTADAELREFYIDGHIGPAFVRLGKQQVVWGQADGLRVLDVVNPFSFREFIWPDPQDRRIPDPADKKRGEEVVLTTAEPREYRAPDVESLTEQALGFRLPLRGLADWVRARPAPEAPAKVDKGGDGRISAIEQSGWRIEYQAYEGERPSRLRLLYPGIDLRLAISEWK